MIISEYLVFTQDLNFFSVLFRLLLATLLGGFIGIDREMKARPAGLRTFLLVSVGSALVMVTNIYIFETFGGDPSRIAAQVISGIGFLGAGTILVTRQNQVKGLTTAAGLWATAAMGLAAGAGFYAGAIITFLFMIAAIKLLHSFDSTLELRSMAMRIYVETESEKLKELIKYFRINGFSVSSLEIIRSGKIDDEFGVLLELNLGRKMLHSDVLSDITALNIVSFVEEIK